MKLNIKDIETKLNKVIRQNSISMGIDVAENITGICIIKSNCNTINVEYTQIIESNKKEDHFHRADHFIDSLDKLKQTINKYKTHKILVIERCYFGVNPEALIHLAHFGILSYTILKKEFDTVYYFGANTGRSIIGFNQKKQEEQGTLEADLYTRDTKDRKGKLKHRKGDKKKIDCKSLVHNYLKTDFNIEFESKDIADAFVLALAGLLQ